MYSFDIRSINFDKLNSMTKYPSILTYHELDERKGVLKDNLNFQFDANDEVYGTEKLDGVNARVIICPDSIIVGSRKDLLWAKGDIIANPECNIVPTLRQFVDHMPLVDTDEILVLYFEVIGPGTVQVSPKIYGAINTYRLFDVVRIDDYHDLFEQPIEKIALWRDHGGQKFMSATQLRDFAHNWKLSTVPRLFEMMGDQLPTGIQETNDFLFSFTSSKVKLTEAATGVPEGIVVRTHNRKKIAKIRRANYHRTLTLR